ncbi:hypothetical protein BA065_03240 [Nanoarchaeota archaeon NZ13-N]|nr:MAG: hypothetical protein BA065_03240 [Nanoarchaeota archaeon NZ13-N]
MIYNSILIGVDEIWLKSERVKRKLMEMLKEDIGRRINVENLMVGRGRIFILDYDEGWIERLRKVFGIKTIYPSVKTESNIESIKESSEKFFEGFKGTFKVVSKRIWKGFEVSSYDLNRIVGEHISKKFGLKVDVKNPDKTLYIEVHDFSTFLYDRVIYGPGGLPLGSEGRGIVLFSGGIDSPVAAYMMGKRGMKLDFLFINIAGRSYLKFIIRSFNVMKEYFPDSRLFVYDLDIDILFKVREGYRQVLYKLIMYKIAEEFSKKFKYDGIVTGESLGQVSSQTIYSLNLLNSFVSIPVYRPLIGFNKDEIIETSKRLGFYDFKAPEICEIERHPTTKPDRKIVEEELLKIGMKFDEEIEKVYEIKSLDDIKGEDIRLPDKKDLIVVDIRDIDKVKFEKGKRYLLICPTGILSRRIYEKLKDEYEVYYLDIKTAKLLGYI